MVAQFRRESRFSLIKTRNIDAAAGIDLLPVFGFGAHEKPFAVGAVRVGIAPHGYAPDASAAARFGLMKRRPAAIGNVIEIVRGDASVQGARRLKTAGRVQIKEPAAILDGKRLGVRDLEVDFDPAFESIGNEKAGGAASVAG